MERCFGVLQARFAIVRGPSRFWSKDDMTIIMKACIVLHNMIVEDERDEVSLEQEYGGPYTSSAALSTDTSPTFDAFLRRYRAIRDNDKHYQLRNDLIEHLWQRKGESDEGDEGDVVQE